MRLYDWVRKYYILYDTIVLKCLKQLIQVIVAGKKMHGLAYFEHLQLHYIYLL